MHAPDNEPAPLPVNELSQFAGYRLFGNWRSLFLLPDRGAFSQPAQISRGSVYPIDMVGAVAGTVATRAHAGPVGQIEPLLPEHMAVSKT